MRVFLGAFGQPGHAFPMLALGRELAARGHHVAMETWSRWEPDVRREGMEFVAAQEFRQGWGAGLSPYEVVARSTPGTRAAIAAFDADAVVHDILTLAPALAAELDGVPVATLVPHLYPPMPSGMPPFASGARMPRTAAGRVLWRRFDALVAHGLGIGRDELNEARRQVGLPPTARLHGGLSDRLVIVGTFPQLEYPRAWPDGVHVVGPLMWEPPTNRTSLPEGDGPIVLVAPSTAQDPRHHLLRASLRGLAGRGVRVLATTNRRHLDRPVPIGDGQRLVDWVSYAQTIPQVDAVIAHAGHGTLVRALSSGVPVVAVPHVGDMAENAARLDWVGAGVRLPWQLLNPATVALATERVLDPGSRFAEQARRIARSPAAVGGPQRAAELVEALARAPALAVGGARAGTASRAVGGARNGSASGAVGESPAGSASPDGLG